MVNDRKVREGEVVFGIQCTMTVGFGTGPALGVAESTCSHGAFALIAAASCIPATARRTARRFTASDFFNMYLYNNGVMPFSARYISYALFCSSFRINHHTLSPHSLRRLTPSHLPSQTPLASRHTSHRAHLGHHGGR
jgi:hypothetical protein